MSLGFEKDIEQVIEIIDRALISKDERVITALRQLLTVTILTDTTDSTQKAVQQGPIGVALSTVNRLNKRVAEVEYEINRLQISQRNTGHNWPTKGQTASEYYFDTAKALGSPGKVISGLGLQSQTVAEIQQTTIDSTSKKTV